MNVELLEIVANEKIAHNIYEMKLKGNLVSLIKKSGQFLHLKMNREDLLLRRPISIASVDGDTCTLIYRVVGDGTLDMSTYKTGDRVDTLGPLGNGFCTGFIQENDEVLVIGGGIGVAPLYELGKRLHAKGAKVKFVLGFANQADIYYLKEFEALGDVIICTDDGSFGLKGHVGVALEDSKPLAVYACGPTPLLKHVQEKYADCDRVYVSLEERMACGIGACHACDTKDKKHRVCTDGPVFRGNEVEI